MRIKIGYVFLLSIAVLLAGCATTDNHKNTMPATAITSTADAVFAKGFDGAWSGELIAIGSDAKPFIAVDWTDKLRLHFRGNKVDVFFYNDGIWQPLYATRFSVDIRKTNAIVYLTAAAPDVYAKSGSGGWVDSHVLLITRKDDDTLYISSQRAVNNYLRQAEHENGRFYQMFVGELKREIPGQDK